MFVFVLQRRVSYDYWFSARIFFVMLRKAVTLSPAGTYVAAMSLAALRIHPDRPPIRRACHDRQRRKEPASDYR